MIKVIFPRFEYVEIPFGYLNQLVQTGITDIYILANEEEYQNAQETSFELFDYSEPKTILEHYQSQSERLNIQVMNTKHAQSEADKLQYYLENVKEEPSLHLFLCNEDIPWVTPDLSTIRPQIEITNYNFVFFNFDTSQRKKLPLFKLPCSTNAAKELLNNESHPCLCYKMSFWDLPNYQWLFNIFVELVHLQLDSNPNDNMRKQMVKLIQDYNNNINDLEKAEESFEKTHKKIHIDNDLSFIKKHQTNTIKREEAQEKFPSLISKMIKIYGDLNLQNELSNSKKNF